MANYQGLHHDNRLGQRHKSQLFSSMKYVFNVIFRSIETVPFRKIAEIEDKPKQNWFDIISSIFPGLGFYHLLKICRIQSLLLHKEVIYEELVLRSLII